MDPGVYLSLDGGGTWKKINRNLGQPDKIVDVKPDPYNENVLWCASWGSGWFIGYLEGTTKGWMEKRFVSCRPGRRIGTLITNCGPRRIRRLSVYENGKILRTSVFPVKRKADVVVGKK